MIVVPGSASQLECQYCDFFTALCPRSRHLYAKMARINIYQEDSTRTRLLTPVGGRLGGGGGEGGDQTE